MEINSAVVSLVKIGAFAGKPQLREFQETQSLRENPVQSKAVGQAQHSHELHANGLNNRFEQMSNMLSRLQQATPILQEAAAFMIERTSSFSMSFAYSISQDESGAITQSFSFSFQFKLAGDEGYTPVTEQPVEEPAPVALLEEEPPAPAIAGPAIDGPEAPLVATEPVDEVEEVSETESEEVEAATTLEEIDNKQLSFDDRVAELIAYYRINVAVQPVRSEDVAPGEDESEPQVIEAEQEIEAPSTPAIDPLELAKARLAAENAGQSNGVIFGAEGYRVGRISTGIGDDIVAIIADSVKRIRTGGGDDSILIAADKAKRINSGAGDDLIAIAANKASRIRSGSGDDTVFIDAEKARRINTGAGDDVVYIEADKASRIKTGAGDDQVLINAEKINRVNAGAGDDVLNLSADKISRINGGAGDDTIILNAEDAGIYFGAGGGNDVVDIQSVGALAINIDPALASSAEEVNIVEEEGSVRLEFASGESLTLNNIDNADMVSVRIGDETVNLQLSEPTIELDISA